MYVGPIRRKKINLWLLILIVLFIVAIVFTTIHMLNSSKANSDNRYSQKDDNSVASNIVNRESSGSKIGRVDSYSSFSDIENGASNNKVEMYDEIPNDANSSDSPASASHNGMDGLLPNVTPSTPEKAQPVTLKNHTYSFQNLGEYSITGAPSYEFVELKKGNHLYRLSVEKSSFNDILSKDGLKSYLEKTFNVQVTSELKTGTINDMQMILCSVADSCSVGYFIITPFNDSEVLCVKVYDANNQMALIKDLSEPLNDINTIKANIQ